MVKFSYLCTFGFVFLISFNIQAESKHSDHDHAPQQEAHIHGYAELTLALEGSALEISLESPAANIVGFEHKATSPEQIQTLKNAKSILESPAKLFIFSNGRCTLEKAHANVSALWDEESGHDGSEHHNDKEHNETHSEITANYTYNCQQANKLTTITVNLISQFPGIEEINAMWVTNSKQGAVKLSAQSNIVRIR